MTQPTDGPVPAEGQAPGPDSTQSIPSQPTQAMPQYAYPTPGQSPAAAQAQPQSPMTAAPSAGVPLADDPTAGAGGGGSRKGLLIGGLVAALVLGGGAVFAAQKLSGGGAQPADVLPGDAYAYLRLDIDPSAGQKIAAVRFLSKFPELKDAFEGDEDPRKKLWEQVAKDDDCARKFDYVKDIEPWLGDRIGAAVRPGGTKDEPNAVVALQVKDEAKAKSALESIAKCGTDGSSGDTELFTKDGYVLFADQGDAAETLAAINKGSLAQNATFSGDMGALGEQGIASMWMDFGGFMKDPALAEDIAGEDVPKEFVDLFKGRYAAALRFDASYIELAGIGRGLSLPKAKIDGNGEQLANLPDDTIGAFHLGGGDKTIDDLWPTITKMFDVAAAEAGASSGDELLAQAEDEFGIKLPGDLKALLGSQLTVAFPDQEFGGDSEMPTLGLKIVSADATKADELIGKFEDASGASGVLTRKVDGDKVYVATTPDYADKLKSGGKLGDSEAFKLALGDVSTTNQAWFVDIDKIEKHYLEEVPDKYRPAVEALRAVGFTTSYTGPGEATFSVRLVSN